MMTSKKQFPRVSFGILVLNGEPFTRYLLRALYPFAYEIIVVEGAAPAAATIATPDGHSIDDTLNVLYQFQVDEDPEHKVQVVTKKGFWNEKDEESQAYASRATGDWLWEAGIDEFYRPEDILKAFLLIQNDPTISTVAFKQITFWGSPNYACDGWFLQRGACMVDRLFRWGAGYRYEKHRASGYMGPVITDASGNDLHKLNYMSGDKTALLGIRMYHYSLLFPDQVRSKAEYYRNAPHARRTAIRQWAQDSFFTLHKPFRVHNIWEYPSWLERFDGPHPEQIVQMWQDIENGVVQTARRQTDDVEALLSSRGYALGRAMLKALEPVDRRLLTFPRGKWSNLRNRIEKWLPAGKK